MLGLRREKDGRTWWLGFGWILESGRLIDSDFVFGSFHTLQAADRYELIKLVEKTGCEITNHGDIVNGIDVALLDCHWSLKIYLRLLWLTRPKCLRRKPKLSGPSSLA